MNKFENLANNAIELKRIYEEELELNKKIKNLTENISLSKDFYIQLKSLFIDAGELTDRKISILKELNSLGIKSCENYIKEAEEYLKFLLDSLIDLDNQYKKARNIVANKVKEGYYIKASEYSLLDIEFDY